MNQELRRKVLDEVIAEMDAFIRTAKSSGQQRALQAGLDTARCVVMSMKRSPEVTNMITALKAGRGALPCTCFALDTNSGQRRCLLHVVSDLVDRLEKL